MEATLDCRLPRQNSNTDITTATNDGNVVYYWEEVHGSSSNGSYSVSDKTEGTELPYWTSSNGEKFFFTYEMENVFSQKRVEINHHDEGAWEMKDLSSSPSKQSAEESGILAKHRKVKLTDLAGVSERKGAQEVYCPNCKSCTTEVLIGERESNPPSPPLPKPEEAAASTPPFPELKEHSTPSVPEQEKSRTPPFPELKEAPIPQVPQLEKPRTPPHPQLEEPIRCVSCFSLLSCTGDWIFRRPVPTEQVITVPEEQTAPRDSNSRKLDIIKSIVYGGLTEAIASLSIVASAASADTPTLNIFLLALANLFGGLYIIGHNLWELKVDQAEGKYQEVLGNKENFFLHAPAAILSFLIFGLLPPLIYSFSFLESDNRNLKIAVVAASSLLCIILLAIGKAYIQTPPKKYTKTVLHYVVVGVGAAGVSYLAGYLIGKLVEKHGWFDPTTN
ncbi:membrane protein of ER body 2-like [Argentina anserina]|uniref:membrane protein of ER body 2-like n=1 Tax=Argentina anserina TaxID=57926 RepID=UPI0021763280|nr:membrane protein of ER body 2-like [Potentilla anserina]